MKREHHLRFLLRAFNKYSSCSSLERKDILPVLEAWFEKWKAHPDWTVPRNELENLCHFIVQENKTPLNERKKQTGVWIDIPFPNQVIGRVVEILTNLTGTTPGPVIQPSSVIQLNIAVSSVEKHLPFGAVRALHSLSYKIGFDAVILV